jgi:hypothetical protein
MGHGIAGSLWAATAACRVAQGVAAMDRANADPVSERKRRRVIIHPLLSAGRRGVFLIVASASGDFEWALTWALAGARQTSK